VSGTSLSSRDAYCVLTDFTFMHEADPNNAQIANVLAFIFIILLIYGS